jgi:hypothetical protein
MEGSAVSAAFSPRLSVQKLRSKNGTYWVAAVFFGTRLSVRVLFVRSATGNLVVWSDAIAFWAGPADTSVRTNPSNLWANASDVSVRAGGAESLVWGTAAAGIAVQPGFGWTVWAAAVEHVSEPAVTADEHVQW